MYTYKRTRLKISATTNALAKVCNAYFSPWDWTGAILQCSFRSRSAKRDSEKWRIPSSQRGDFPCASIQPIQPWLLPWVGDFLSGRRQRTRVNGTTSNWFEVTCGVPQGTKLGPVIFLAMVNSVAEHHGDRCKFVDGITVVARNKPSVPTNPELQRVMLTIRDDASKDHMTLNTAKCSTMRIAAAGRPNFIPLRVDGTEVPHVSTMKLLGVTIQGNLKWDKQVEAMVAKANTRRYFITVLKRAGVQLRDLVRCYCTYIRPLLEYAAPVWHPGLTRHQADLLEQVQRQCLRTLLPDTCYAQALRTTGLPTLQERRSTLCLNFAHGLLSSQEFTNWLPPRRGSCHQKALRNNRKLNSLPSKTKRFDRSPIAYLVKLLNMNSP